MQMHTCANIHDRVACMYTRVQGIHQYMYVDGSVCPCMVSWSFCFPPTVLCLLSFVISDLPLTRPPAPGEWDYAPGEPHESAGLSEILWVPSWF